MNLSAMCGELHHRDWLGNAERMHLMDGWMDGSWMDHGWDKGTRRARNQGRGEVVGVSGATSVFCCPKNDR